jgi:hypothetical protein
MNRMPLRNIAQWIWIAFRFMLFGIGGFMVLLCSSVFLIAQMVRHNSQFISPFFLLPLLLVGAVMMLYGAGEWGRWAYLWVILSFPISLAVSFSIPGASGDKGLPVVVSAVVATGVHAAVRAYYRRKDRIRQSAKEIVR